MSKEKRRVPKLRFPGFTEDWEQRKFKDIAFKRGKISEADLPYIEFEDINSGIGTLNKNILQKVGHKKGILFEAGDVLFGKLRPYLQNWLLCQFMGIAVGDFWVFQPQIVSSAFLYYLIQSEAYQSVANISSGTKMPRSSWLLVSETQFSIPKYKEATMIGEFFTSIDKNITLHQRKLDNLKLKKKALLQKLFPKNGDRYPELRFPGFTDAWEQRKLESLFTKYEDKVNTPSSGYWRLGLRSHCKGTFHTYIDAGNELETAEMNRVKSGNFILNITFAWERALAVTNDEDQDKLVSHRFPQFKPNNDLVIDFFKHTLMDKRFKHHLELSSPGGAGRNKVLKVADMLKYELLVPSIKEQNKISSFLNHVDYIITLHQRKLDHLQLQKKALLQQMFV